MNWKYSQRLAVSAWMKLHSIFHKRKINSMGKSNTKIDWNLILAVGGTQRSWTSKHFSTPGLFLNLSYFVDRSEFYLACPEQTRAEYGFLGGDSGGMSRHRSQGHAASRDPSTMLQIEISSPEGREEHFFSKEEKKQYVDHQSFGPPRPILVSKKIIDGMVLDVHILMTCTVCSCFLY